MSADTSAVRAEEQLDLEALSAYLAREGFSGGRGISVTNGVPKLRLEIDDFLFACDGRHRGTTFGGLRSV